MKTIYEYFIYPISGEQLLSLPEHSIVINCEVLDDSEVKLFILKDTLLIHVSFRFVTFTSGQELPDGINYKYIDTLEINGIDYHLFQILD